MTNGSKAAIAFVVVSAALMVGFSFMSDIARNHEREELYHQALVKGESVPSAEDATVRARPLRPDG